MAHELADRTVSRREFTSTSVTALFVGMTVWMTGCGSGGDGGGNTVTSPTPTPTPTPAPSTPTTPVAADKTGAVADNHGHAATVTSAQLQTNGAVALRIQGTADHDHTVELTADQVAQVAAGARVTRTSTQALGGSDGYGGYTSPAHTHTVTFN